MADKTLVQGTNIQLVEDGNNLVINYTGQAASTSHAWFPQIGSIDDDSPDYATLSLSSVPAGFLRNNSDWSFAVRISNAASLEASIQSLFTSDVTSGGVGVYAGPSSISFVDQKLVLSGMTNSDYDQTYEISSINGYYSSFLNNRFNSDSSYRVFKYDAGGGTYYCVMNNSNTGDWNCFELTVDPDTISDLDELSISGEEQVASFSSTDNGTFVPWGGSARVDYTGGVASYTSYWAKMSSSNFLLSQETGELIRPNKWLLFSWDSSEGAFDAYIGDVQTNDGTSTTFAISQPSTIHFGNETAGHSSAAFYNIQGMGVSSIMIMNGETLTTGDAAEFTSNKNSYTDFSTGLQAKVSSAWTFDSSGPITDKGSIDLSQNNGGIGTGSFQAVVIE